jgi:succinate dehydrogenase / fumarate reductase cytochrome b subunit
MELGTMRRWHSVSGLVPLGAYLLFHAWEHWPVQRGRDALFARLSHTQSAPLELVFVLFPLLLHAGLGCYLSTRSSEVRPAYASSAFRRLQLVTGLVTALFLGAHLLGAWLPRLIELSPIAASYGAMREQVAGAPGAIGYAVGLAAVCTHFGQGLGAALIRLTGERVAERGARGLGVVFGLLLWLAFMCELATYATGARLL